MCIFYCSPRRGLLLTELGLPASLEAVTGEAGLPGATWETIYLTQPDGIVNSPGIASNVARS